MNAASTRGGDVQIVLDTLRRFPAREAFRQDDLSLSYADVADDLARWASLLRQRGLRPGEGFGVLSSNRPEVWACQVAPTFVRGRYTALHPTGSFDDHLYQCDQLIQLVKDRKGAPAAPKAVEIVDDLPMTAVGKTDKKALRAR